MAFLIDQLIGTSSVRPDDKRLSNFKRPLPQRPRDFFDLISALGRTASWEGLTRGVSLREAEPAALGFVVLGRWPTAEELAALPQPYKPAAHVRAILQSREFRRNFLRRVLEAHAERRRIIHVRIPRCGTAYLMSLIAEAHPVIPVDLGSAPDMQVAQLLGIIGPAMHRFPIASTIFMGTDRLGPFVYPPKVRLAEDDPLNWEAEVPPCRPTDLSFAVLRDPEEIVLSHVNGVLAALACTENGPAAIRLRAQWGAPPAAGRDGAWKDLGRRVFDSAAPTNPICTALGDGSAARALEQCRVCGITLVGLGRLTEWAHTTLGCEPATPLAAAPARLRREDLDAARLHALRQRVAEDRIFHDRFAAKYDPSSITAVRGVTL